MPNASTSRRYDTRELATQLNSLSKYFITPSANARADLVIATTPLAPGDTVVHTSAAAGDYTKLQAGQPIFIVGRSGKFELNAVKTSATSGDLQLLYPAAIDAPVGARVVTAVGVNLGDIDENGVKLTGSATTTDIKASTSRLPIASTVTDGKLGGSAGMYGFNLENLQTAFGIPENVQGDGSSATPFRTAITGTAIGTEGLLVFRAAGTMKDGVTQFFLDFCNCTPAPSVDTTVGGTNPAVLALTWSCTTIIPTIWS